LSKALCVRDLFDDRKEGEMLDFFNGYYIEKEEEDFSGFNWKRGFFTTFKIVDHKIIDFELHLNRLSNSLRTFGINLPNYDYKVICNNLLNKNELCEARVKLMIYKVNNATNCWIKMLPLKIEKHPRILSIYPIRRENDLKFKHKSINYSNNIRLNILAKQNGFDDFLFLDKNNYVLETTFCNIFFANKNEIITPQNKLPLLNGIIREKIISLVRIKNIHIHERNISLQNIADYKSAFITNSIIGLQKVIAIDNTNFDNCNIIREIKGNIGICT
jgi:4-amino-4-deoxychorismate lyase